MRLRPFGQRQPKAKNIVLTVSDETYDRTAAETPLGLIRYLVALHLEGSLEKTNDLRTNL
jgi:hypothetical protein